jgi:hypothetical protein
LRNGRKKRSRKQRKKAEENVKWRNAKKKKKKKERKKRKKKKKRDRITYLVIGVVERLGMGDGQDVTRRCKGKATNNLGW